MAERIEMLVRMQVTVPQALALQAMFKHWNYLASVGSSRNVAFYVDGDGNFKPKCKVTFSADVPALTPEMETAAMTVQRGDARMFDFDAIAWMLRGQK